MANVFLGDLDLRSALALSIAFLPPPTAVDGLTESHPSVLKPLTTLELEPMIDLDPEVDADEEAVETTRWRLLLVTCCDRSSGLLAA